MQSGGFSLEGERGKGTINKRKKDYLGANIFSLGKERGEGLLSCRLPFFPLCVSVGATAGGEGFCDRLACWCLTRKFHTDGLDYVTGRS